MSKHLLDQLTQFISEDDLEDEPSDRVERALKKALAATTPERAGSPWDVEEEEEEEKIIEDGWA